MPRLPGFVGGTYTPRSYRADCERTVNLVPEVIESKEGENGGWLDRRPGINIFSLFTGVHGNAIYTEPATGRVFFVAGNAFVELFVDGSTTGRGSVAVASSEVPATITGNGNGGEQILITSGGLLYVFDFGSDSFAAVTVNVEPNLVQSGFMDGYFLLLSAGGILQWSALEDGSTWDALDIVERSTMADPWIGFSILHREIRLFGAQSGEAWTDTGDALLPFQLVQGSVNEQGIVGVFALQVIANTVVWVGRNVQGQGIVWMASDYIPKRISDHSVEAALARSAQLSAARGMVIQKAGHTFYILRVPDLPTAWVFDISNRLWCEWAQLVDDEADPWIWQPFPAVATTFGFNRQLLVGEMDGYTVGTLDDTGSASNTLLAVSSESAPLLLYDWGATLRATYVLTGTEGAGSTGARPVSSTQAFASARGGALVDLYTGASVTVPQASGTVDSEDDVPQWVRSYAPLGSTPSGAAVRFLVVAAGGGEGLNISGGLVGGGGAGAVKRGTLGVVDGTYVVNVGLAGAQGVNGANSTWNGVVALGGARGGFDGGSAGNAQGYDGGNGSGAGCAQFLGFGVTTGDLGSGDWQSFPGGLGLDGGFDGETDDINASGAGAGAGGLASGVTQNHGGSGGAALADDISGASVNYASGGAGRGLTAHGTSPASVYGGGGGADRVAQNGVVRLRYLTGAFTATGGVITTSGGDTIHTFTATGEFVVSAAPTPTQTWAAARVAGPPSAAFVFQAARSTASTNGTTVSTISATVDTTGATLIVVAVSSSNGAATCVDSVGNTYTGLTEQHATGPLAGVRLFYKSLPTTSATHSWSSAGLLPSVVVFVFGGTPSGAVLIGQNGDADVSAQTLATGPVMPVDNGTLIIMASATVSLTAAPTFSSPFTSSAGLAPFTPAQCYAMSMYYYIQPAAGVYDNDADFGAGGPDTMSAVIAAFGAL